MLLTTRYSNYRGLLKNEKVKLPLFLLISITLFLLQSCGSESASTSLPNSTVKTSGNLPTIITSSPEEILTSDLDSIGQGLALFDLSILISDTNGPHKDLMLGCHAFQRKILLDPRENGMVTGYLLDVWSCADLVKVRNVLSGLVSMYGEATEIPLKPGMNEWKNNDETLGSSERSRIIQKFEMANANLSVQVQLQEALGSSGTLYELAASYSRTK